MEASAIHAPGGLGRVTARGPLLRLRTDDQLVALFRMGYDEAFGTIHARYSQRLFAYMRQMLGGSRSDAEDALQDVFLRAYGALRQDDRPVTLRAWLYRVAHNRCIDQLRRPVPAAAEVYQLSRPPLRDPFDEAERREDLQRLVRDVQRLPEQQRSALLMREMEGLSYAELAGALRTTIPAVKSLLVRARIGLVEAGEARDTACAEIRADLTLAHDRGVRATGRSRRHMRDCAGCRDYRRALRGVESGFGAVGHGGPLATLAKLLGIGGASTGAAAGAGGSAALVGGAGGSAAVVGGAATATKVVAIVCCAAVVGGGAVEVHEQTVEPRAHHAAHAAKAAPVAPRAAAALAPARFVAPTPRAANPVRPIERSAPAHRAKPAAHRTKATEHTVGAAKAPVEPAAAAPVQPVAQATPEEAQTGGAMAPDESSLPDPSTTAGQGGSAAPTPPAVAAPSAPAGAASADSAGGAPATVPPAPAPAASAPAG
jgi:RNA polymerase sigma factor (sigma-70 family)